MFNPPLASRLKDLSRATLKRDVTISQDFFAALDETSGLRVVFRNRPARLFGGRCRNQLPDSRALSHLNSRRVDLSGLPPRSTLLNPVREKRSGER